MPANVPFFIKSIWHETSSSEQQDAAIGWNVIFARLTGCDGFSLNRAGYLGFAKESDNDSCRAGRGEFLET